MKPDFDDTDPLSMLLSRHGYNFHGIKKIVTGEKYAAVMLCNGNIGVCATLGHPVSSTMEAYKHPNLTKISNRIILNAYFCATLNYRRDSFVSSDLYDYLDFSRYKRTVMIGFFASIVEKCEKEGIKLSVFDHKLEHDRLLPDAEKMAYLNQAQAVILTSTTVFNKTFNGILKETPDDCAIFMLGPSSIMTPDLFEYRNIKMISGALFEKFDDQVLLTIANNGGTKDFLKYKNKKILLKSAI